MWGVSSSYETQDEVVSRVLLPSRLHASVELEVLHDAAEVAPFLPFVSPRQLAAVISAPRAFIDRTGLGVRPVQDGRFFPEFDGQCLLGDSTVSHPGLLVLSTCLRFYWVVGRHCRAGLLNETP